MTASSWCGLVSLYVACCPTPSWPRAALPEAELVVDASCTAGADQRLHRNALELMETLQITVVNREV